MFKDARPCRSGCPSTDVRCSSLLRTTRTPPTDHTRSSPPTRSSSSPLRPPASRSVIPCGCKSRSSSSCRAAPTRGISRRPRSRDRRSSNNCRPARLYRSPASCIDPLANQIVNALQSPDLLALQGIRDASGPVDDGVTDAGPPSEPWRMPNPAKRRSASRLGPSEHAPRVARHEPKTPSPPLRVPQRHRSGRLDSIPS